MSGSTNVKKNFIYNLIYQFIVLALPLITTPYVARVLGAEEIGQYSYSISLVSYFTIFAILGTNVYGQRCIAFFKDDPDRVNDKFWNIFTFRLITALIALALYLGTIYLFEEMTYIKLILVLNILDVIVDISWYYQGQENYKQIVLRGLLVKIVCFICVFVFIKNSNDTWKYALITYGGIILGNFLLWIGVVKKIHKPTKLRPFSDFKDIFLVFLPSIASQVYLVLDKSMINWITGSDYANGCYEQSEKLVRAALIGVTAISSVLLSRISNLYSKGDSNGIKYYLYKAYRIILLIALPIMFGTIGIASFFIPIYLGDGYDMSIGLLEILALLFIFVSLASITGLAYLVPTNQQNIYTISIFIAAGVNFSLNLILIRKLGAYGAAISSVVAECIGTSIQLGYCFYQKQLSIKQTFLPSWKYLVSSVIMFVSLIVLKQYLAINFINLVLLVLFSVAIYFIVLLVLRDSFLLDTIINIKNKIMGKVRNRKEC